MTLAIGHRLAALTCGAVAGLVILGAGARADELADLPVITSDHGVLDVVMVARAQPIRRLGTPAQDPRPQPVGGRRRPMIALAALALALPAFGAPGADSVQQAYDAARVEAGARHDDDLRIRTAQCGAVAGEAGGAGRYYCQIDFVRAAEPRGRLYFTVVTIEKRGDAWTLLGGLCKGPGQARLKGR